MRTRLLHLFVLLLITTGCSRPPVPAAPSVPPVTPAPIVEQAPGPSLRELAEAVQKAQAALHNAAVPNWDKVAYKKAWDELLPAVDALLDHPDGWSIDPKSLSLRLVVDQPAYRVFAQDGEYQLLGGSATMRNLWVQWRDKAGTTHAQVLYRGGTEHEARAYGSTLLLLSQMQTADMQAWQLQGSAWQPTSQPFATIGDKVGDMAVTRKEETLVFAGGWWEQFTADGSKRDYSAQGVPYLCPGFDAPAVSCYKLQVDNGRVSLSAPDTGQIAKLGAPESIKANLAIGYRDGGPSADPATAREAQSRAREGMLAYLKTPVSQQLSPADFAAFFQGTAPGSVNLIALAPSVRVYKMITRPEYQPAAYAWLQWWSDPASPRVKPLELDMFDSLRDAALFGAEPDRVLVYTAATFPTRHNTGRSVTALRYDSAQQDWVADTRAFPEGLPNTVGEVALSRYPNGAGLGMYRPNNPPMSNEVRLDPQGLTICDTEKLCLRLLYKDHQFQP